MGYFKGFTVTGRQIVMPKVTVQYPEQKRPKPERFHGRHVLGRYEDGMEKCIGCELCAGVCPARCIYVRGADNPPESPVSPGERYGFVYEINFLRCIHCDLCVEACPTEAITESKLFEFSFTTRSDAIYTKAELLVDLEGRPRQLPWEDWHDGDDRNTSGWVRATSPAGNAAFEGRPLWSGELGYGVRPAQSGQSDPEAADVPADWDISLRETGAAELKGVGVRTGRAQRVPAPATADEAVPDDHGHEPDAHGDDGH
ncbi:MAG TPA: NADH-quinone oxidoreductase subunit NuoI [Acidimicrobiales bacterium]|jgi:NADH-quinone oxidoreductase subunit I